MTNHQYDYVVIGSGFGGSVSALRLSEKGYRVLVVEKGGRKSPDDFPRTNWDVRRWMWMPEVGARGIFRMTFLPHVTAVSGVGVGGGSLVYANTLPMPTRGFYEAPIWSGLAHWAEELAPHYATAKRMLGATENKIMTHTDEVTRQVGRDLGFHDFRPSTVAVYFGEAGRTVPDPYFGGEGPDRTGCIGCGACMIGCRHGAKNTLDKNYLYLAERRGARVEADTEVTWVRPLGGGGYVVEARTGTSTLAFRNEARSFTTRGVIFAGGVLGTVQLMLRLKQSPDGLPMLSDHLGDTVRTNSEVLMGIVSRRSDRDLSKGIAIGSILHTGDDSHVEPVRYPAGSGFFRMLTIPHVVGSSMPERLASSVTTFFRNPLGFLRAATVPDWAKQTMILLYMKAADGQLRLKLGRGLRRGGPLFAGLTSELSEGEAPKAFLPEADELAERYAEHLDAVPQSMFTETLMGTPTTAHILGGARMGEGRAQGVIDHKHRVFGYDDMYVIDGAAVSANPGVNPSLTICALAERAMSFIPQRGHSTPSK